MKEIKDYLHLYLGSAIADSSDNNFIVCHSLDASFLDYILSSKRSKDFKPILRPLSDATPEEVKEIEDSRVFVRATPVHQVGNMQWTPETFRLALSKHFDLFGLIESGLAIDKTTLNKAS